MIKYIIIFCTFLFFSTIRAEVPDTVKVKTAREAAFYAASFPGAGQLYNRKYFKSALIAGMELWTLWQFNENRKYFNSTQKSFHLEERNKYAWWMFYIYLYGIIDAVVDAHLEPFEDVMSTNLDESTEELNEDEDNND